MEVDAAMLERTLDKLRRMTSEESLRTIAVAIASAGIPEERISDLFLGKVIYSKELYGEEADLTAIVAKTSEKDSRARGVGKTPPPAAEKREPDKDATSAFRRAVDKVRPSCGRFVHPSFNGFLKIGVDTWKSALTKAVAAVNDGDPVGKAVADALVGRVQSMSSPHTKALSLVPIDRYVAHAVMLEPYGTNMEALRLMAASVGDNLRMRKRAFGFASSKTFLPVGREFRRLCLSDKWVGYSEEYFRRHMKDVWDDMLSAWAFSFVGRDMDVELTAWEQLAKLLAPLPGEVRDGFSAWKRAGGLTCVLQDGKEDRFGHRVAVFGVYDGDVAARLGMLVARNVDRLKRNNLRRDAIVRETLSRELVLQGVSTTSRVKEEDMRKFGGGFGSLRMW